jgi:uncharacterized protein
MAQVHGAAWKRLAGDAYPFMRHEFLLALGQGGSVCGQSAWISAHLLVIDKTNGRLYAVVS